MTAMNTLARSAALLAAVLAAACGGGGSPGDTRPDFTPPPIQPVSGPDKFLMFPNPQVQADGTVQTTSTPYADAYYRAIDPLNERDTLAKWKAKNGFETGTGQEITVVFGDQRDLGYGRRMNARRNPDGTPRLLRRELPGAHRRRLRVFQLQPRSGHRARHAPFHRRERDRVQPRPQWRRAVRQVVQLQRHHRTARRAGRSRRPRHQGDARTVHLMPRRTRRRAHPAGFHRPAALQPRAVLGVASRGDVEGHMHPFEVDVFGFDNTPGFTRAEQEAAIKTINRWILCTYPLPAPSTRARGSMPPPRERERVAGHRRVADQGLLRRRRPAQPHLLRYVRAPELAGRGPVHALRERDPPVVPHLPHHARQRRPIGPRFHDLREIPGLHRPHQGPCARARQHAAREDRFRCLSTPARARRTWRPSSPRRA